MKSLINYFYFIDIILSFVIKKIRGLGFGVDQEAMILVAHQKRRSEPDVAQTACRGVLQHRPLRNELQELLGYDARDNGQRRVPAPPESMTGCICADPSSWNLARLLTVSMGYDAPTMTRGHLKLGTS